MKDNEFDDLLRSFDEKIQRANNLNLELGDELRIQRSASAVKDLNSNRVVELVVGILVSIFLGSFLYDNSNSPILLTSGGILLIFTLISIFGCIHQLILISNFDMSKNVAENQATLVSMRTYHLNYLRLAVLQFPFYMAYILVGFKMIFGVDIWEASDRNWRISNLILGLLLIPLSIWLCQKIRTKNLQIKWVRQIFEFSGGEQITKALSFLEGSETR